VNLNSTQNDAPSAQAQPRARPSWYRDPLLIGVLGATLALDQLTKWLVTSNMAPGQSIPAQGIARITYVHNTGGVFGLFQGYGMILTIIAFAAVGLMIWLYRSSPMPALIMRAALGLQMGGAIGNLIDRLRVGSVIDFIDLGPWPVFNVADSSIVVGITVLAWYFGTGRDRPDHRREAPADEPPPPSSP